MNRWFDSFDANTKNGSWNNLKDAFDQITIQDAGRDDLNTEIARAGKVIKFLDEIIANNVLDPELMPHNMWDNFNNRSNQCLAHINAYLQNHDLGSLTNLNNHLDNLLPIIQPYIINSKKSGQAAGKAFNEYARIIQQTQSEYLQEVSRIENEIKNHLSQIEDLTTQADAAFEKISQTAKDVCTGDNNLHKRIEDAYTEFQSWHKDIQRFHDALTKGDSDEAAISLEIKNAKKAAMDGSKAIEQMLEQSEENLAALSSFHEKIFGKTDENGELQGGLEKELATRRTELNDFRTEQQKAYKALVLEINTLLPGATSAGLATAYKNLKDSFTLSINANTIVFYVCIILLLVIASISWSSSTGWDFLNFSSFKELYISTAYKLPFVLPIIWVAYIALKRKNQSTRLQQEYAHKEAIAASYQSFKQQLEEHGAKGDELAKKLIEKAIDAITFNASITLDSKSTDKMPLHEIIEETVKALKPEKN